MEIVIDGISEDDIKKAMRVGINSIVNSGSEKINVISAGNYGGKLGPYLFYLKKLRYEKVILKARTKINNIDFKKLSEINDMKLNFENISKIKILLNKQIIELGKVFSIKVISINRKEMKL